MKPVKIVRRDFKAIARVQPDWHGTTGRADWEARTIYIDKSLPARTIWSERVILEHEKAHFVIMDSGVDEKLTDQQHELLADFLGLVRTPNKNLHINERYMKRWLIKGMSWKKQRYDIVIRLLNLLGIKHPAHKTERIIGCL